MDLAIIIVNYNSALETKECLQSLQKANLSGIDYKIILVDNGSKQSLLLNKNLLPNNTVLLRSEANLGFTGGNNLGISHAITNYHPEFFLLLNNDTTVEPNFIFPLMSALKNNPKVGIATPKIYFQKNHEFFKKSYNRTQKGHVFWYAGGSIDWANMTAFHRGVDEIDRGQFDQIQVCDFATGCAMMIKREVVEKIGILDKNFFLYYEDTDYSVRAKKQGYFVAFVPTSIIWHKNASSSDGSGSIIHEYYQNRNKFLFIFKHAKLRYKLTAAKLLLRSLLTGDKIQKKSSFAFITRQFGKQSLI